MRPDKDDLLRCLILGVMCTVSVGAAYFNLDAEPGASDAILTWTLAWASTPITILVTYLLSATITRDYRLNFRQAAALMTICAIIYAYYALNGSTADDPESASHMHILFVPMLVALGFAIPLALVWSATISRARVRNQATHAP